MKKTIATALFLLAISHAAFGQHPHSDAKPEAAETVKKETSKSDPMLLTDAERKELGEALDLIGQAKKQYDAALTDVLDTPIERMNALETVGRLQRAHTILQATQQHFVDLREKHKATRPDCEKCEYGPDFKGLTKPKE